MVAEQSVDHGASRIAPEAAGARAPAIVMVAVCGRPAAIAVAPPAALGRRLVAGPVALDLVDDRLSREHATIAWEQGGWTIRDRGSRNGTFVDGVRIAGEVRRRGDAIVRLGHTVFALVVDGRGHPAPDGDPVIGPELARAYAELEAGASASCALVLGEPGAGKAIAARRYHAAGPRRAGPFIAVDCATLPEGLGDRLLFGGARRESIDGVGHFQLAAGGTLYLASIADLEARVQLKLARALATGELVRAGATTGAPLEANVIAATARDLRAAVAEGRFYEPLYRELARVSVRVPPLRERVVDLIRNVQREIADAATVAGRALTAHPRLLEACWLRPWPGNVHELRPAIRRAAEAALTAGRDAVQPADLDAADGRSTELRSGDTAVDRRPPQPLGRDVIAAALTQANGVIAVAARSLGIHRKRLRRLVADHGLRPRRR